MKLNHWIKVGDTHVKVESTEQLDATCRMLNLTLVDEEELQDLCGLCGQTRDKCYLACTQTYSS